MEGIYFSQKKSRKKENIQVSLRYVDYSQFRAMTARKEDEITASIKTTQAALVISSTVDDAVSLNEGSSSLRSLIDSKEKNIIVFYGSQTGTAEEFSNRFVKEINQRTCKVKAVSADLNDLEWVCNKLIVVLIYI